MSPFLASPLRSVLVFGLGLLVVVLGLAVTLRAFQGARRNDSRRMLLLAVGLLLITVIPSLSELIVIPWFIVRYFAAANPAHEYALIVSRTSEAVGILVLLYSVHGRS